MDLKSKHAAPVLTDPVPINKSRLSIHSSILPYSPPTVSFPSVLYSMTPRKKPIPGKRDDVRATSWLDSMKCSSPRKILSKDSNNESPLDENDAVYCSWLLKYPSALTSFEHITSYAKGKKIALFLDYDGTLSPIVNDPDSAFMSDAMRDAVRDVADYFPTAIISGRCRDKVYEFVGLTQLYYAGSHGMDIMGPVTNSVLVNDHPNCIRSTDKQVFRSLVENTKGIKGANVENNKFCVSVHYRLVDQNNWSTIAQCVHDVIKEYPRLRLTHGRKVLEVRPVINWDKGKAVEFLLESLGLSHSNDVLPIYIGDDRTDEDAFKVLREQNRGYGILVSSVPKESNASYSLRDPTEVMEFLKSLVRWRKTSAV